MGFGYMPTSGLEIVEINGVVTGSVWGVVLAWGCDVRSSMRVALWGRRERGEAVRDFDTTQ